MRNDYQAKQVRIKQKSTQQFFCPSPVVLFSTESWCLHGYYVAKAWWLAFISILVAFQRRFCISCDFIAVTIVTIRVMISQHRQFFLGYHFGHIIWSSSAYRTKIMSRLTVLSWLVLHSQNFSGSQKQMLVLTSPRVLNLPFAYPYSASERRETFRA